MLIIIIIIIIIVIIIIGSKNCENTSNWRSNFGKDVNNTGSQLYP